jgi:hypothetical protein
MAPTTAKQASATRPDGTARNSIALTIATSSTAARSLPRLRVQTIDIIQVVTIRFMVKPLAPGQENKTIQATSHQQARITNYL